jgi:hypothetical protein
MQVGKEVAGQPKRQSKAAEDYTLTISGTKNSLNMSRRCDESEILNDIAGRIVVWHQLHGVGAWWCLVGTYSGCCSLCADLVFMYTIMMVR